MHFDLSVQAGAVAPVFLFQKRRFGRPSVFIDMPVSFFDQIKYRLSILHCRNGGRP
ncbi:MAG TPA: hypothetical protein VIC25_00060 [Caulobacteraceae bacterium]